MTAVWTLVLIAILLVAYAAMWRGWQHRVRRTSELLPALPVTPAVMQRGDVIAAADGVYVSTTRAGEWLDRVSAHGLGARATGSLTVYETGLCYERRGADTLWLSQRDVVAVRDESAQAGTVRPGGGIVLVTWKRAGSRFDTGFVPRRSADHAALLDAIDRLARESSS